MKDLILFLLVVGFASVSASVSSHFGAKAGDFDNWVFATNWENEWVQDSCNRDLMTHFKDTSYSATSLSLHGIWPNYDNRKEYDYPVNCIAGNDDFTQCTGNNPPSFCSLSSVTLQTFNVTDRWMAYAPEYSWGDLATHEWTKHGSCTGWSQQNFFSLGNDRYHWLKNGSGSYFVTAHVGTQVSYSELHSAFLKDTQGKKFILKCDDCDFSGFLMGWDADPDTLMPSNPIDFPSKDTDSCKDCDMVNILAYSTTCKLCRNHARGPVCDYDHKTAGTENDPCLQYSGCHRCPSTAHDGVHYCTSAR